MESHKPDLVRLPRLARGHALGAYHHPSPPLSTQLLNAYLATRVCALVAKFSTGERDRVGLLAVKLANEKVRYRTLAAERCLLVRTATEWSRCCGR